MIAAYKLQCCLVAIKLKAKLLLNVLQSHCAVIVLTTPVPEGRALPLMANLRGNIDILMSDEQGI